MQILPIQIPAAVSIAALVIEGLLAVSPVSWLFQLVPILCGLGAGYFAWNEGFHFVACLYMAGSFVACGAFFSVRLIANLPAIGIFALILGLPRLNEGPQADLFAVMHLSSVLLWSCLALLVVVLYLGVRFTRPRIFMAAVAVLSILCAITVGEMLSGFGWVFLQRLLGLVVGVGILLAGYIYYRFAGAWFDYVGHPQVESVNRPAVAKREPHVSAELQELVLQLGAFRKLHGYRFGWLEALCREGGISDTLQELIDTGRLQSEGARIANAVDPAPRAPVTGGGLGSHPADILAVSRSASSEEIKEAYQRMASFFHHEKLAVFSDTTQQIARKMAGSITKAYKALSKS
jgi:hypothetical protein